MPTREEEYQAATKEPRGKPLCPACGRSEYLYRSKKRRGWWECGNEGCPNYRKPFPSPSYGAKGKPSWWQRLLGKR